MGISEVIGDPDNVLKQAAKKMGKELHAEELATKETLLKGLESTFFETLEEVCPGTNTPDLCAAGMLPTLLDVAVRVEEKREQRKFMDCEKERVRARKAAELLPKVPLARLNASFVHEFCDTRRLLWEAIVDGAMAQVYDVKVIENLLHWYRLSDNEQKTLLRVLRERFKPCPATHHVHRYVLSVVKASCDRAALRTILHGLVKHADNKQLMQIAELLALKPVYSF